MLGVIEAASSRNVLFVGETIRDEYRFVAPLGKPSKENIIAVEALGMESWSGGVVAAHAHAKTFCNAKTLTNWMAVCKTRFVERDYNRKLFEVQTLTKIPRLTVPDLSPYDVVAVCDFGHGLIDRETGMELGNARFLAVCAQTNAANAGFNLITKYDRADYIVIDEPEARLAAADRESPIEAVIEKLASGRCDKFVVTHGRHGAYGWDGKEVIHAPAVASHVVDTMGAGDAFFAVTAPMAPEAPMADLLRIGNAAAALKCGVLGHRSPVTKQALVEFLNAQR